MKSVAVAVALALAVTACGSDPEDDPVVSPSPTATATTVSPTPTPTPTATGTPDQKAVLEAAVRDYYAEANRALGTGDVNGLLARTSERCSCRGLVRYIREKYANGSVRGGTFTVRSVRPYDVQSARAVVQVVQDAAPFEVLDRSGKTVDRGPAEPNNKDDLYLVLNGGRWIVDNVVGVG